MQGFRTVFGAARKLDAEVRRIAKLSSSQLWALSEVAGQSGITVNGLAERMALHQTTTSNLVNMLVERKLIRRVRDVDDQRIVHLQATGEGRRMLNRVPAPHCGIRVDALKRMPAEELRACAHRCAGWWPRSVLRRQRQTDNLCWENRRRADRNADTHE
jgi:DNA-binding MarR family transcriptional regulator